MTITQIVVLAIIQGITEFLPISSSGHLNLVHLLSDWPDQGTLIDVAVHVGSLAAVLVYFRRDVGQLVLGGIDLLRLRWNERSRLAAFLVLASVPVFIAGFIMLASGAVDALRLLWIVATANLVFALLLLVADRYPTAGDVEHIGWRRALFIGTAQILSLIPGVSRSGVTMTAARFMGISRTESARFSMLLAIPTILGAGAASGFQIYRSGDALLQSHALIAAGLSFLAAIVAIWALMRWLRSMTFLPFVVYRVGLSAALFAVLWSA